MQAFSFEYPRLPALCLLLAWLMGIIGLALGLAFDGSWFGRFGSVIVLFALIGEFSLLKGELLRLYARLGSSGDGFVHTKDYSPSRWHNKKSISLHLTIHVPVEISISSLRNDFLEFCDQLNLDAIIEPVK